MNRIDQALPQIRHDAGPASAANRNWPDYARGLSLALRVTTGAVITVAAGNALGRIIAGAASDRFGVNRVFLVILALA